MLNKHIIAIIIPCYKGKFLPETLKSIASQTNKNFNLYIGIDDSPEPLEEIISDNYQDSNIVCKRFETNLGKKSLTQAWQRCINMSQNEEYIWLFSDDDIMPQDAIERFYTTISSNPNYDLLRFPLQIIDENNKQIKANYYRSNIVTSEEFLIAKLSGQIDSAAIEYIFKKDHFFKQGCFEDYPMAWCSDDATWAKLGSKNNICLIEGAAVSWRNVDGFNISNNTKYNREKIVSTSLFLKWIYKNFGANKKITKAVYIYAKTILIHSVALNFTYIELFKISKTVGYFSTINGMRIFTKFITKKIS